MAGFKEVVLGWITNGVENIDEEDEFYDDDGYAYEEERRPSGRSKTRSKPRHEEDEYDDDIVDLHSRTGKPRRPGSNVHEFVRRETPEKRQSAKLLLCYPTELSDATAICDHLKNGTICIVNMAGIDSVTAQRTTDVLSGMTYALNGEIERIDAPIYVIAPAHTRITHGLKSELKNTLGSDEIFGFKLR